MKVNYPHTFLSLLMQDTEDIMLQKSDFIRAIDVYYCMSFMTTAITQYTSPGPASEQMAYKLRYVPEEWWRSNSIVKYV
jgi:hypothetical protein